MCLAPVGDGLDDGGAVAERGEFGLAVAPQPGCCLHGESCRGIAFELGGADVIQGGAGDDAAEFGGRHAEELFGVNRIVASGDDVAVTSCIWGTGAFSVDIGGVVGIWTAAGADGTGEEA